MNRICRILVGIVFGGIGSLLVFYSPTFSTGSESSQIDLNEALNRAMGYAGFDDLEGFSLSTVEAPSQPSPFPKETIVSPTQQKAIRAAWRFRFHEVILFPASGSKPDQIHTPLDFDVFIDSKTGELLQISSHFYHRGKGLDSTSWAELSFKYAGSFGEVLDYADQPPPMSFIEALSERATDIDWLGSNRIEAYWVQKKWPIESNSDSVRNQNSQPYWMLFSHHVKEVTIEMRDGRSLIEYAPILTYTTLDPYSADHRGVIITKSHREHGKW